MHHPILSDIPGAKTIITFVIIIALILTIIAFGYFYMSDFNEKYTKTQPYLKSAYSYEIINTLETVDSMDSIE